MVRVQFQCASADSIAVFLEAAGIADSRIPLSSGDTIPISSSTRPRVLNLNSPRHHAIQLTAAIASKPLNSLSEM